MYLPELYITGGIFSHERVVSSELWLYFVIRSMFTGPKFLVIAKSVDRSHEYLLVVTFTVTVGKLLGMVQVN